MSTSIADSTKPAAEIEIVLSAKALANLPRNVPQTEFAFVVGDSRYRCPSAVACFLSPRICRLQMTDPTIDEFHIETLDPRLYFGSLLKLGSGSSLAFRRDDRFVKHISGELWDAELYETTRGQVGDDLTVANVIDRLRSEIEICGNCEREIAFYSSHFYELELKDLLSLPIEMLSEIISHDSIRFDCKTRIRFIG
jgi:hypothetical protein